MKERKIQANHKHKKEAKFVSEQKREPNIEKTTLRFGIFSCLSFIFH